MSQLQNKNSNLFMIECEDIILREYRFEDLDDLFHLTWQPHFHEFLLDWNVSREQREEWILEYEIPQNRASWMLLRKMGILVKSVCGLVSYPKIAGNLSVFAVREYWIKCHRQTGRFITESQMNIETRAIRLKRPKD